MTEGKDEEMLYGLTVDERDVLRQGLAALPDAMPPRTVWEQIREQAEAEGLLQETPLRRHSNWCLGGGGLAAAVVLAVMLLPGQVEPPVDALPNVPQTATSNPANGPELTTLQALMVQSRQLENDLNSLPASPRVVRAGTAATISELEDRIAAIDYQLNDPEIQLTPDEQEIFWRERVRLMKSLVGLRYAQAQRTAF